MTCSPIALFVYKRLYHTKTTLESLQRCVQASDSHLYIFSDNAKTPSEEKEVQEVRDYIKTLQGFKSITIVERETNFGLAKNITSGVTQILKEWEQIIVLEDDLLLGKHFLTFMNEALHIYKENKNVWHISGWNYPFNKEGIKAETYFIRIMNCWGWATWADRWKFYEKNLYTIESQFTPSSIKKFNLDGSHDFYSQIKANLEGKKNTWAIFWYATIFLRSGLCLNPRDSLVQNIGLDGNGENCKKTIVYDNHDIDQKIDIKDEPVIESVNAVARIKDFYKKTSRIRLAIEKIIQIIGPR